MRKVLIVDDDPFIRKLIATTLEDISGYRLQEAGDGMEAVERAQVSRPEIVFLDIDMPRLNGIEACRRLRSDPATAHIPVILLTAKVQPSDTARFDDLGVQGVLAKPFDPMRLAADVGAALGWER